jgi:hypothetical protein
MEYFGERLRGNLVKLNLLELAHSVSWKSRVYRGFSCTASIIGNADESPTS